MDQNFTTNKILEYYKPRLKLSLQLEDLKLNIREVIQIQFYTFFSNYINVILDKNYLVNFK